MSEDRVDGQHLQVTSDSRMNCAPAAASASI
jgi:hypothetical protein